MSSSPCAMLVLSSTPNKESAEQLAQAILGARLAACVKIIGPVTSCYHWDGQIQHDQEYQLQIKSQEHCWQELQQLVKQLHPYQVPELLQLPINQALPDYLTWLQTEIRDV